MLEALRIRDLGVIEDVEVEFGPGLCVVTGETGTGKTMVVTGLQLLFGNRADATRVRDGADQASVEGRIRVAANSAAANRAIDAGGQIDDGELLLRRTVTATGRSRAQIGGTSTPVGVLSAVGEDLFAVHGQADQIRLASPRAQRRALDRVAGIDLSPYRAALQQWQAAQRELAERIGNRAALVREADLLAFGLAEIDAAAPTPGEDAELDAQAVRLAAADELRHAARVAHRAILGDPDDPTSDAPDARSLLAVAHRHLLGVAAADPQADVLAGRLAEVAVLAEDVGADLGAYAESVDADPVRLAVIESRRAELRRLIRKYPAVEYPVIAPAAGPGPTGTGSPGTEPWPHMNGPENGGPGSATSTERSAEGRATQSSGRAGIDDVLAWAQLARARLAEIDTSEEALSLLDQRCRAAADQVRVQAGLLTATRRAAAERVGREVTAELRGLAMSGARLIVEVRPRPAVAGLPALAMSGGVDADGGVNLDGRVGAGPDGVDDVEFLLSPDGDSPARPLSRGASGGEMSRVMLAVEVVLAGSDPAPVLVFDEVDAGVGGRAAVEVGRRLARLARRHQVIVVTHLAQVAAFADVHLVVDGALGQRRGAKRHPDTAAPRPADGRRARSVVRRVEGEQRLAELARMLAGRDTPAAREHAAELLADAYAQNGVASGVASGPPASVALPRSG